MVVAGVDCHKDTHTIVFLNELGKVEQEPSIPATTRGYVMAIEAGRRYGDACWDSKAVARMGRYSRSSSLPVERPCTRYRAPL